MTEPHVPTRLAGLDGLRAIAALAVFVSNMRHLVPMGGTAWGLDLTRALESGVGVAFFFVLSGYLLTLGYWKNPCTWLPWHEPFRYVGRRLSRLLPAYLVCVAALIILKQHWETQADVIDTTLHLVLAHNLAEFTFYGISEPFWTIAVQAQFYLLLPLVMLPAHVLGRRPTAVVIVLLGLSVGCYLVHVWVLREAAELSPWPFPEQYLRPNGFVLPKSVLAHLPVFLVGAAGGFLVIRRAALRSASTGWRRLARCVLFWIAAMLMLAMITTPLETELTPRHARYAWPLLPLALLGVTLFVHDSGLVGTLQWAPIRWIGIVSYGIYIFHMPCLRVCRRLMEKLEFAPEDHQLMLGIVGFALTSVVASACYLCLERPVAVWVQGRGRTGDKNRANSD